MKDWKGNEIKVGDTLIQVRVKTPFTHQRYPIGRRRKDRVLIMGPKKRCYPDVVWLPCRELPVFEQDGIPSSMLAIMESLIFSMQAALWG